MNITRNIEDSPQCQTYGWQSKQVCEHHHHHHESIEIRLNSLEIGGAKQKVRKLKNNVEIVLNLRSPRENVQDMPEPSTSRTIFKIHRKSLNMWQQVAINKFQNLRFWKCTMWFKDAGWFSKAFDDVWWIPKACWYFSNCSQIWQGCLGYWVQQRWEW